jgi:hypothetical protein
MSPSLSKCSLPSQKSLSEKEVPPETIQHYRDEGPALDTKVRWSDNETVGNAEGERNKLCTRSS